MVGNDRVVARPIAERPIDAEQGEVMAIEVALPYRSDWRDMSSVLDYCKGKGADRSSLEARFGGGESLRETLNALEQLGLVERSDSGDVRLTARGEALAYAPDQSRLRDQMVEAMLGYPPYRFPLERALAAEQTVLDGPWVEHIWQVDMRLGQPRNRVEEARTFFYRLADESGLGTYRRGVRGQTTRLELASDFGERLRTIVSRLSGELHAAVPSQSDQRSVAPATAPSTLQPTRPEPESSPNDAGNERRDASTLSITDQPMADGSQRLPGLPEGISVQVDMSDWDLERIEGFLRLIGYLPPR